MIVFVKNASEFPWTPVEAKKGRHERTKRTKNERAQRQAPQKQRTTKNDTTDDGTKAEAPTAEAEEGAKRGVRRLTAPRRGP